MIFGNLTKELVHTGVREANLFGFFVIVTQADDCEGPK